MNTLSLTSRYRPVRIGWCVRNGDLPAMRQAARMSFALWGGWFNPIIPVDDVALAQDMVESFRIDVLWPVVEGDAIVDAFIAKYPHLANPFFARSLFTSDAEGWTRSQLADIYHPVRRFYDDFVKGQKEALAQVDIHVWQESDPLSDAFLLSYGGFPSGNTGRHYLEVITRNLISANFIILPDQPIPPQQRKNWALAEFSRAFLEQHHATIDDRAEPGFYLGSAASFDDLVMFWNLRAEGIDLHFVDLACLPRYLYILKEQMAWMAVPRWRGSGTIPATTMVWTRDATADLSEFGPHAARCRVDSHTFAMGHARIPIQYFTEAKILGTVSSSANEPSSVSFQLPEKPFINDSPFSTQNIVVSVDAGNGLFGSEDETFQTFYIPKLNEFYWHHPQFGPAHVRVEPDALGIVMPLWHHSLRIHSVGVTELVSQIFATVGIIATPSKPGLIAKQLIGQMGGLNACTVFKISGVRTLIEKHGPQHAFTTSAAKSAINERNPETETSGFKRFELLSIEPRDHGTQLTVDAVFRFLQGKGMFRPGLEFVCPRCRLEFWVSLDDAATETACDYCGFSFNVAPQLRDRDWRYRRTGLFGKDDHQEGAIPVVLTLEQLKTVVSLDMLYTTAMSFRFADGSGPECETDFVTVSKSGRDYLTHIVIGEAKTRKPITPDDVRKLRAVADRFPRNLFKVYIVFSKLTGFTPEEIDEIGTINDGIQRRAIMLSAADLERWYPYSSDGTAGAEVVFRAPVVDNLEDMARATAERYFGLARGV